MLRIFSKFLGLIVILALVSAGNHCLFEDIAGASVPAEHACPLDGSTESHGGACKSVVTTLAKHQSVAIKAVFSFDRALFIFSSVFLLISAGFFASKPRTFGRNSALNHRSSLTRILALAPNAPPQTV